MSDTAKTRIKRYRQYNSIYEYRFKGFKCYYCGDTAQTVDHVPPLDYVYMYGTDHCSREGIELIKVPACKECNSKILNDVHLVTLEERVLYVYKGIQKYHKKVLAMPNHEEDELAELGYALRVSITDDVVKKQWIENRLQYMEDVYDLEDEVDG